MSGNAASLSDTLTSLDLSAKCVSGELAEGLLCKLKLGRVTHEKTHNVLLEDSWSD